MAENNSSNHLPVDGTPPAEFLEAKKALKRFLIALPFEEKIRRVIQMQQMSSSFKKDPKREIVVWRL